MDLYLISLSSFFFVTLLILGIQHLLQADEDKVASRAKKLTSGTWKQSPVDGEPSAKEHPELWRRALTMTSKLSPAVRLGKLMDQKLAGADVPLRGEEFVVIVLASAVGAGLLFTVLTANPGIGMIAAVIGSIIPFAVINTSESRRLKAFNNQIGDALAVISNSLRSGFSFLQALDMVRKELPDPISKEFASTLREINLGTATEDALRNLAARLKSEDLSLVVTAVLIQRQVGGNLAEVLDNIAHIIRERIRIQGEVKTLTAQGRISGLVVGLLPVGLAVVLMLINPSYITTLFTTSVGLIMLATAFCSQMLGMFLIKKIVDVKF